MDALTADDYLAFSSASAAVGRAMAGALVEIGGVSYAATIPQPRVASELIAGGTLDGSTLTVRVTMTDLPGKPGEGTALRWKRTAGDTWGPWWIVRTVAESPLETEYLLHCVAAN
jgi:hypothetical protein